MKTKQPNQKIGKDLNRTFFQKRHTDVQQEHEKMLNTANYQRHANQTYSEVPLHTRQNGREQKVYKYYYLLERVWRKGNLPTLLVGM